MRKVSKSHHITGQVPMQEDLLHGIGNIQIKKPTISTFDSYISCSSFHSLIINLLHYSTKVYLCFPWVFNLCQQWLCSNINETCPSTKISTVAVQICTALKQVEWAATHLYTCNHTHIDRHISLFYSYGGLWWADDSFKGGSCFCPYAAGFEHPRRDPERDTGVKKEIESSTANDFHHRRQKS